MKKSKFSRTTDCIHLQQPPQLPSVRDDGTVLRPGFETPGWAYSGDQL